MIRGTGFRHVAAALLTSAGLLAGLAALAAPAEQAKIDWVRENRDEFFFWSRYEDLLANPAEFPKPLSFYNPNVLVDGEQKGELPRAQAGRQSISPEAWQKAVDWAFARNTHALLVMRNGVIEYEKWADGFHRGQMLPVRSFTKTLSSLLIGIAIGEGRIRSIDEPVGNYLNAVNRHPAI